MNCLDRSQMRATWISAISSVMNTHRKRNHLGSSISLVTRSPDPASSCEMELSSFAYHGLLNALGSHAVACLDSFQVYHQKRNTYQKGTLIKRNTHPKDFFCQTQGNLALNYFCFPNMASFFLNFFLFFIFYYYYYYFNFFFWSPGITPAAQIGLWTLSPRFLSGFCPS